MIQWIQNILCVYHKNIYYFILNEIVNLILIFPFVNTKHSTPACNQNKSITYLKIIVITFYNWIRVNAKNILKTSQFGAKTKSKKKVYRVIVTDAGLHMLSILESNYGNITGVLWGIKWHSVMPIFFILSNSRII